MELRQFFSLKSEGLKEFPQILADQLTLSEPGWQIMPSTLLPAPHIFSTSYGPDVPHFLKI